MLNVAFTDKEQVITLDLFFYNNCSEKIEPIDSYKIGKMYSGEFPFHSNGPSVELESRGTYLISLELIIDDQVSFFRDTINVRSMDENIVDTLFIPKVKEFFSFYNINEGKYFICDVLCEGEVIDYYPNGKKRISGIFKEGNPIELTQFTKNGRKESKEILKDKVLIELIEYHKNGKKNKHHYYNKNGKKLKKVEFYNKEGSLQEYIIYKYRIYSYKAETYNSNGELTQKEVFGYY